jgi:ribose transport system permease protein
VSSASARLVRAQRTIPLAQIAALVALFTYGVWTIAGFGSAQSVRSMLVLAAILGIASLGQTLVIILGGLDLSVAAFIVAGAILVTELCGTHGWPFGLALAFIVLLAGVFGAGVGYLARRYGINPLILTLASGSIAVGGCLVWTHAQFTGVPPSFLSRLSAANGTTFGAPVSPIVVIWAVVALGAAVFLHRTRPGRKLYATGANMRAAEFALISTVRVWTVVFAVSAVCSALAGVVLAGFAGADQSLGDPYLFAGLTAVVVGGTTFGGRRGDYSHTVLGALLITVLTTILVGKGYDAGDQQIIFGVMILLVIAVYGRDRRLRDRV